MPLSAFPTPYGEHRGGQVGAGRVLSSAHHSDTRSGRLDGPCKVGAEWGDLACLRGGGTRHPCSDYITQKCLSSPPPASEPGISLGIDPRKAQEKFLPLSGLQKCPLCKDRALTMGGRSLGKRCDPGKSSHLNLSPSVPRGLRSLHP